MSLPSKRCKKEIKFVNIFIDKHGITVLTTTTKRPILENFLQIVFPSLPKNVLLQCSTCSVFKKVGSSWQTRKHFRDSKCMMVTLCFIRTTISSIKRRTVFLSRSTGGVFSISVFIKLLLNHYDKERNGNLHCIVLLTLPCER